MAHSLHQITQNPVGTWSGGFRDWPVIISVPPGLEGACGGIGRREGHLRFKPFAPGLLKDHKSPQPVLESLLQAAPIWSFGTFIKVFSIPLDDIRRNIALPRALDALSAAVEAFALSGHAYWMHCAETESAEARKLAKQILTEDTFGLTNNPSHYDLTVQLVSDADVVHGLLGPSISVKERFAYRHKDVGASINPVLAAAMVRLAPPCEGGLALDPTCGSGTLLAERLAFSQEHAALGIDISRRAGDAFAANLQTDPAQTTFTFKQGNSADRQLWAPCQTVLANLPFGIRVRQPREELEALYYGVTSNAATCLQPGGRALLTSSFRSLLDSALDREKSRLIVLARYKAEMGGIVYQIAVASRI